MLQTNYCTVKQNMGVISEDTPGDSDRLPDFTKINGKVTFVPTTASGQAYQLFDEEATPTPSLSLVSKPTSSTAESSTRGKREYLSSQRVRTLTLRRLSTE